VQYLNAVDYTVMAVYFAILVGLGFYLKRMASASLEDYFLGGKKLPWWALGVSGMASFLDITGTMIIVSFLYMLGPRGLFIEFRGGAVLVLAFAMIWVGKWHRRSNRMTGAEWQIYRFGTGPGGNAARIVTAVAAMAFPVGMLAYMIKGIGPFLATFLPWSPTTCALVMIAIAAIYTMVSGFYGVVFTDIFQSGIIMIAVVTISTMAIMQVSDSDALGELAQEVTGNSQWLSTTPNFHTPMPRGYEQYSALMMFAFFYLTKTTFFGMGAGDDPKYFGARNERECGLLTFLWTCLMMFRWPMMMAFAVLGLFLVKDLFPDQKVLRESEIAIKSHLVQQKQPGTRFNLEQKAIVDDLIPFSNWENQINEIGVSHPETARDLSRVFGNDWQTTLTQLTDQDRLIKATIPKSQWADTIANIANNPEHHAELVTQLKNLLGDNWSDKLKMVSYEGTVEVERILPAVLLFRIPKGLRGLLLIALIAASMSTFDSTVNRATGYFTRDIYQAFLRPNAGNRELIYASYGFIAVVVLCGIGLSRTTESINDIWGWIIMSFTAGLAVPQFLRLYWWRFNASGVVSATLAGLIATFLQRALWPDLDERIQFMALTSIALTGAILGTYLTPPTPHKVLDHFYQTTRPFGLWGTFKRNLPPETRRATTREHINDLLALPFALGWQITLFLLPMQLIIRNYQAFGWTLIIFAVCLVGMYFFWYRNLPSPEAPVATSLQPTEPSRPL